MACGFVTAIRKCVFYTVCISILALSIQSRAAAQAVLDPNQISGVITFTNKNPDILSILTENSRNGGFDYVYLYSTSTNTEQSFNNYGTFSYLDTISPEYEMTVESSEAGTLYEMQARVYLDNFSELYMFDPVESTRVYPEPAADAIANIMECVGLVHVTIVDQEGLPFPVQDGTMEAWYQMTTEYGWTYDRLQAYDYHFASGFADEYLAVKAGREYRIETTYQAGSDLYSNTVAWGCEHTVEVACDEIIDVECQLPLPGELGTIIGNVDMEGADEHPTYYSTRMTAYDGPFENRRYDKIESFPSQGQFELENLVPTTAVSPEDKYRIYGELFFGEGYNAQYFHTPWLTKNWSYNESPSVLPGEVTDLKDTFVISPGTVRGNITLAGPPSDVTSPCFADVSRDADHDYNNDGIPDNPYLYRSRVEGRGTYTPVAGALYTTYGAYARTGFEGAFNETSEAFEGRYDMLLGGLNREVSLWEPKNLVLEFADFSTPEVPESYQYSELRISENADRQRIITPGETTYHDFQFCMSEVRIRYHSTSSAIYNPNLYANGEFKGTDYFGGEADYRVNFNHAYGTPLMKQDAAQDGTVVICAPQGSYRITPYADAINPNGTNNRAEFPEINLEVGCRQIIDLTTDLQINLDPLPQLSYDASSTVKGSVNSDGNVTSIVYTINDGEPVTYCTDCGVDPSFEFSMALAVGFNSVTVEAFDEFGDHAEVQAFVTRLTPPVSLRCDGLTIQAERGQNTVAASYELTASGGCDTPVVECSPAEDSRFSIGTTEVTCEASDSCGSKDTCAFDVVVNEYRAPDPTPEPTPLPTAEPTPEPTPIDDSCSEENIVPHVSCSVDTPMLWPPNHQFVDPGHSVTASNTCAGEADSALSQSLNISTTVWSDETEVPVIGDGSGMFAPDARLDDAILLRSERRGTEDGRVYLLITEAENEQGARDVACCAVVVPHDMSQASQRSAMIQASNALTSCIQSGGAAPEGFTQHGVSAELTPPKGKPNQNIRKGDTSRKKLTSKRKRRKGRRKKRGKRRHSR